MSTVIDRIINEHPDILIMDGYDDCIAGIVERAGQQPIVCYDKEKILEKLQAEVGGMRCEAEEYFEFNMIGACGFGGTLCFLTKGCDL